jgi:hypothetical protein
MIRPTKFSKGDLVRATHTFDEVIKGAVYRITSVNQGVKFDWYTISSKGKEVSGYWSSFYFEHYKRNSK